MSEYKLLPKNRYFEVLGGMNADNHGDRKVGMLSEIDMTSCVNLRRGCAESTGVRPSYTAFVTHAVAHALRTHPYANRMAVEWPFFKRIVQLNSVNITVAVERDQPGSEQAVYAGTIPNADTLDLVGLTRQLQGLANATEENSERWRTVKRIVERLPTWLARTVLRIPLFFPALWVKHRGGAVMISSPAKYGVDMMIGAWPWPIGFSFGYVKERPMVIDGQVEPRTTLFLTMSFDRRLMGGAPAARFFKTVCDYLEQAENSMN